VAVVSSRVGTGKAGVEVFLELVHVRAQAGDPRAYVYRPVVAPPSREDAAPLVLEPALPGALSSPRRIEVLVRSRLLLALSPAHAPPRGRDAFHHRFDGAPYILDPFPTPTPAVEVSLLYECVPRSAPRAEKLPPLPSLGLSLTKDPRTLDAIAVEKELLSWRDALARGDASLAEHHGRRAVQGDPGRADAWSALADALLASRRSAHAAALARWASEMDPRDPRAAVVLAESELARSRLEEAKAAFDRARALGQATLGTELSARVSRLARTLGE
jgi:hypothetical protein